VLQKLLHLLDIHLMVNIGHNQALRLLAGQLRHLLPKEPLCPLSYNTMLFLANQKILQAKREPFRGKILLHLIQGAGKGRIFRALSAAIPVY
jgi:hypothetical protein